jgi:hypothetical protein
MLSNHIFEAVVTEVFYDDGVCTINPLSVNTDTLISNVPLPYYAGNGNAGIFFGIRKGSRVVAMYTSSKGRESTVIASLIPKQTLFRNIFNLSKPSDVPSGTTAYPQIRDGRLTIKGDRGARISLLESGDIYSNIVGGRGTFLKRNRNTSSYTLVSEDASSYSNAIRQYSGTVRRISGVQRNIFPKPEVSEVPLFADPNFSLNAPPMGFFTGSVPLKRSFSKRKRNPEISEYRMVINEFSTDHMFTGFDNEVDRYKNAISLFQNSDTLARSREPGNTLYLAEHELIEVIGGNVVDINGNILDINYRKLSYGGAGGSVPDSQIDESYDQAKRISRRGIGYHFQLATNTTSSESIEASSASNFIFDIDKEGMLKVNIPASSDTGNIPFVSSALFAGANDSVDVSFSNESQTELVPVTLRNEKGEAIFPGEGAQGIETRETGIRYSASEDTPYFPAGTTASGVQKATRVNPTKYHNMYAAAESLIANMIRIINVPQVFTDSNGLPEGISPGKPFEVQIPETLDAAEGDPSFSDIFQPGDSDFPTFMSVVAVNPGFPAIDPGGETLVAGTKYTDDIKYPPFSNSFTSTLKGNEVVPVLDDGSGDTPSPIGGRSIHMNLEGSIEASIGKDNSDEKSIMLDTDGSLISWIGKDKRDRSLVMQTDGEVLFNIGGSYPRSTSLEETPRMNVGRFELRVNVTDKGFVPTQFGDGIPEEGGNPKAESDYIISISEQGIVIAGMKVGTPMVLRNDGPVLIESSSSSVTLKGIEVRHVEGKGRAKTMRSGSRGG